MRLLMFVPLLLASGCGGEEEKAKAPAPARLEAGQWETTLEVASSRTREPGEPLIDMPRGTRTTAGACLAAGEERPPVAFYVGSPFECDYRDYRMRNGRLTVALTCRHPAVDAPFDIHVLGRTTTGNEFQGDMQFATASVGAADVLIASRVTARRTGACTPPAQGEGNQTKGS
jgi:hypothetical protein